MSLGRIELDPVRTPGICHAKNLTKASADMASRCLQANKYANHIFTTDEKEMGAQLHNHVVYHALSLWALGADAQTILKQTKRNFSYQLLPPKYADERVIDSMQDLAKFKEYVGKEEHYLDFVEFYEREIEKYGYQEVLQKYLLGDSEIAKSIFPRLYQGYCHALMHVGIGLEFNQVPILAEGLAEATVHHDWWYTAFIDAASAVAEAKKESAQSLVACVDECLQDKVITNCVDWDYMKQFEAPSEDYPEGRWFVSREPYRDGVVGLAKDPLARIAGRFRVSPDDDLEKATAEIINTSIYIAAAAQRAPHEVRYDFFLIHGSNGTLWHSVFIKEPSITRVQQARLIETTGRMLLMLWAGMGCPVPDIEHLKGHKIKQPSGWDEIFARACLHEDDGHMIKLIRALANGEKVSKPYDHLPEFRMKQDSFLIAAHAAIDSASKMPMAYIRHFDLIRLAGLPEAWEEIPKRA